MRRCDLCTTTRSASSGANAALVSLGLAAAWARALVWSWLCTPPVAKTGALPMHSASNAGPASRRILGKTARADMSGIIGSDGVAAKCCPSQRAAGDASARQTSLVSAGIAGIGGICLSGGIAEIRDSRQHQLRARPQVLEV